MNGLAVWRWWQLEFLHVFHVHTQLLVVVLMLQRPSSAAKSWRRHAVRRLTERHLRPGPSSTAAVTSSRRRVQHEVDRERKDDGWVLFSGDLRHGLEVTQLQRVSWFINDVSGLLECVRRFLLTFRRYDLYTPSSTSHQSQNIWNIITSLQFAIFQKNATINWRNSHFHH